VIKRTIDGETKEDFLARLEYVLLDAMGDAAALGLRPLAHAIDDALVEARACYDPLPEGAADQQPFLSINGWPE
jgi:hypothetical protein